VELIVNGEVYEAKRAESVAALLEEMGLGGRAVVVVLNDEVIRPPPGAHAGFGRAIPWICSGSSAAGDRPMGEGPMRKSGGKRWSGKTRYGMNGPSGGAGSPLGS